MGVDHLSHKEDYFTPQEELEKGPGGISQLEVGGTEQYSDLVK